MIRLVAMAALGALLAGCQSAQFTDPSSEYYDYKPGTKLVIHKNIRIPPGRTNIYFQFGQPRVANQFKPLCRFYVYGRSGSEARTVEPGEYLSRRWERVRRMVWHDGNPVMFASMRIMGGDGPSHVTWGTWFYLDGDADGEPRLLMCGQLGDWNAISSVNGYVSFDQIQETLGGYMSLTEPQ